MKRGTVNQVFYYILAIIIISFIFLFGYQQLTRLLEVNEQAKFITFKDDFQKAVNNVYYKNPETIITYSSTSANKPLILPRDVKQICFNKLSDTASVEADSKYFTSFNIDNLKFENDRYCMNIINSKFSFTLENKIVDGKTVVEIR